MRRVINKYIRVFGAIATTLLCLLLYTSSASAAIVGFVAQDKNGKYYEYKYDQLLDCYLSQLLGASGPVYKDFRKKNVRIFVDDGNGYIDYDDVLDAYMRALLSNKKFDANKYTASKKAKKADMPAEIYVVTKDGKDRVKYTAKTLEKGILAELNGADTAAKLKKVVEKRAKEIGLDLTLFKKLSSAEESAALSEVLAKKPQKGYASLSAFKNAFNKAVTNAAAPAKDKALQAVNAASTGAKMKEALLEYDLVLGLDLQRYSLKTAEQNSLASRLLGFKPFGSAKELQVILHTVVISIRSGFTIEHIPYSYTLKTMLSKQMRVNPQTDLYGGGWKSAKEADVQYYLDPYNFIDLQYDGSRVDSVRILADPNLRVRQRPTTESPQVKDSGGNLVSVWKNEIYAILGEAQAEAGTSADSKGTWYKIRVSGKEGWVSGNYCEAVGKSFSATSLFQFLLLSECAGAKTADLNKLVSGKGILNGTGSAFRQAAREHKINEFFLVSLALHESGNGTSILARGIEVEDKDNRVPGEDYVTVYNMFGIGALDSNPEYYGSMRAYEEGWFTPEKAIIGGAKFASEWYVHHPSYRQDTLYKMRWNPDQPATHQYATDIGWAAKQVPWIRDCYELLEEYTLTFHIPRYKK